MVAIRKRSVVLSKVIGLLVILVLIEAEGHVHDVVRVEGQHDAVNSNNKIDRGLMGMKRADVFLNASLSAKSSALTEEAKKKKRHECMGLMLSLSRTCRRKVRRRAAKSKCTGEGECKAMYDKCYGRLRRKHFIKKEGCGDKQILGRITVPMCMQANVRFVSTDARLDPGTTREQLIFARLSNITDPTVLSNPDSPQGQAYNWITQDDGLQLPPTDPTLEQRYILASLYYSTNGDGWNQCFQGALENECYWYSNDPSKNNQFLSATPECTWHGVSCRRGRTNATNVESVALGGNNLIGSLPDELGLLPNLAHLNFERNHLAGRLPSKALSKSLLGLGLGYNSFIGFAPDIQLPLLRELKLHGNRLSGPLDDLIGGLPRSITSLWLGSNRFEGTVPESFGRLTSLGYADLMNNRLTGTMPAQVCINKEADSFSSLYVNLGCPHQVECDCCDDRRPCPTPRPTPVPTTSQAPSSSSAPTPAPTASQAPSTSTAPTGTPEPTSGASTENSFSTLFDQSSFVPSQSVSQDFSASFSTASTRRRLAGRKKLASRRRVEDGNQASLRKKHSIKHRETR